MSEKKSDTELEIMIAMRKVLSEIIKDTTPSHRSMIHPLSENTINGMRACLGMIAGREKEIMLEAGASERKPYFTDEPQPAVVSLSSITKEK